MELNEFSERAEEMVDFIADYMDSLFMRRVTPIVSSGYVIAALPSSPPENGDSFQNIMKDVEKYIMPGLTHWNHPAFHAFFPASSSYSAILAAMLKDILGYVNFDWSITPCGSELEIIVLDWYGKLMGLPDCFLRNGTGSRGSGIIFRSTSESIFASMLTARCKTLRTLSNKNPSLSKAVFLSSLVAYCSVESHKSMEKVALVSLVNIRVLDTNEDGELTGDAVDKAIKEDIKIGLVPFFVSISLNSEVSCACDRLIEIGPVCEAHGVWLHVDAAYAGTAMICPEFSHLIEGIEYASSLHSNPDHWMLVHVDCSVLFVKDRFTLKHALVVERTRKGYSFAEKDWCFPTKSAFRALKLFFVMRSYGVEGLQKHIRNHINLAKLFENCVNDDDRFEVTSRRFGLVCFRLKASDIRNRALNHYINNSGKLCVSYGSVNGKYVIRFFVCSERASERDITYAWKVISENATTVLDETISDDITRRGSSLVWDDSYKFHLP